MVRGHQFQTITRLGEYKMDNFDKIPDEKIYPYGEPLLLQIYSVWKKMNLLKKLFVSKFKEYKNEN